LITSPVPTCLVHNCETSWGLLYFHLLSPLSRDQILFDPHHHAKSEGSGRSFCSCLTSIMNFSKCMLKESIPVELCEEDHPWNVLKHTTLP